MCAQHEPSKEIETFILPPLKHVDPWRASVPGVEWDTEAVSSRGDPRRAAR